MQTNQSGLVKFRTLAFLLVSFSLSVGCYFSLSVPYFWICTLWVVIFIYLMTQFEETAWKAVWFNVAFAFALVGMLELYSYLSYEQQETKVRFEGTCTEGHRVKDDVLGYAPQKSVHITSRKICNESVIYDVAYTINSEGLRITPPRPKADTCVLFFGGSYTYGEGVTDENSLPYLVGDMTSMKSYNFGYSGYGPHQMLAAVQNGLVSEKVQTEPKIAIYQMLLTHIERAAGKASWDRHGPCYEIRRNELVYSGHFDDVSQDHQAVGLNPLVGELLNAMRDKSFIYKKYFSNRLHVSEYDLRLTLKIIQETEKELKERHGDLQFSVILWDKPVTSDRYKLYLRVKKGLDNLGIRTYLVSDMLPRYFDDMAEYELSDCDRHPNPKAYRRMAEYVVKMILSDGAEADEQLQAFCDKENQRSF